MNGFIKQKAKIVYIGKLHRVIMVWISKLKGRILLRRASQGEKTQGKGGGSIVLRVDQTDRIMIVCSISKSQLKAHYSKYEIYKCCK